PPAAHSRSQSTCRAPASRQMTPRSAPAPTSPSADNRKLALPADSPHTAIRTVALPGRESCSRPAEYSTPEYAPPASPAPPPLLSSVPATPRTPPAASPKIHWPKPVNAADCSGTSQRKSSHPSSASSDPAPRPSSSERVVPHQSPSSLSVTNLSITMWRGHSCPRAFRFKGMHRRSARPLSLYACHSERSEESAFRI